jgi:IS30 family transposase
MKRYKQLTHKERYQIYALIKEGYNYTKIAKNIGVNFHCSFNKLVLLG